jgi:hypothetical protein
MMKAACLFLTALLPIGLAAPMASAADKPLDCRAALTGDWRGQGKVTVMGPPVEVESRYQLKADGGFESMQRYRGQDGAWQEQRVVGEWTTKPGRGTKACEVTMTARNEWGEGSTTTTYRLIGPGRFRFDEADYDMVRVEP